MAIQIDLIAKTDVPTKGRPRGKSLSPKMKHLIEGGALRVTGDQAQTRAHSIVNAWRQYQARHLHDTRNIKTRTGTDGVYVWLIDSPSSTV